MDLGLKCKNVVIIGALGHIGRGICKAFIEEGCRLAVSFSGNHRNVEADDFVRSLVSQDNINPISRLCNVTSPDSVSHFFEDIGEYLGQVDVLIYNAGIIAPNFTSRMNYGEWESVIETNLTGAFLCCREANNYMLSGASIVNISSISAKHPSVTYVNYAASKAGLDGLTIALARELGPRVRVNSINVGPVDGGVFKGDAEYVRELKRKSPMRRIGVPQDVANLAVFLASNSASYLTGQNIVLDGGLTI
jgi:3-oxoacyl-[acyl-carrier protein] reductase